MGNPALTITHVATGLHVTLKSYFFTEYSDSIDTKYNSVSTYGRMDPLVNYQGSTRKISLGIRVTPQGKHSASQRRLTHTAISRLQKMQYPVYEKGQNALTISRSPIVAVSLGNIIRDGDGKELICAMNGFAFTPNVGFTPEDSPLVRFGGPQSQIGKAKGSGDEIGFKNYNFRFDFTVLHRAPPGFATGIDVLDPDSGEHRDKDMKFLGGYAFGPQKATGTGPTTKVFTAVKKIGEDQTNNVQTLADVGAIFD